MKRILICAAVSVLAAVNIGIAQSLDDLNIQIHGYATQAFLYTTHNNLFTADTSDGTPAWTEAALNVGAQPTPKLRIGVQGRYFLLGNYGNAVTLDWAAADYKASDRFGVRFGKVKTPFALFNEIQDIDPSYLWALLPQGVYPITSRNSILTHYGGVVYGTLKLNPKLGKLEYRGFGGEGYYSNNDGYFVNQVEAGFNLPQDIHGRLFGAALHWRTPLQGLMVGASDLKDTRWNAPLTYGALTGTYTLPPNSQPNYFAMYEKDKVMVAYEYTRNWGDPISALPGTPASALRNDDRSWYAMASYKVTGRLTAGLYDSQNTDHQAPLGPARYQKEWVYTGRCDFSQFLYLKAEEHFISGTGLGYDTATNPNGLQTDTKLTVLKIGVSF